MKWEQISARAGRNEYPELLALAVLVNDTITEPEEIARGVLMSWISAEFPERRLSRDIWLMLFREVGFLNNRNRSDRPDAPVTVFRGTIPQKKSGMSWTDDPERAQWFARRFDALGTSGKLYTLTVPPPKLLARFTARGENEWVVDTTGMSGKIHVVQHG